MCNACGNHCCGSDMFGGCGCDGCDCEECWSDDEDEIEDETYFICEAVEPRPLMRPLGNGDFEMRECDNVECRKELAGALAANASLAIALNKQWQPIKTAPKDCRVLLYGTMQPMEGLRTNGPEVFTGYWDDMDGGWCGSGSTWEGPFYTPTHWMPLPESPPHTAA